MESTLLQIRIELPSHVDPDTWEKETLPSVVKQIEYATKQFTLKGGVTFEIRQLTRHGAVKI